MGGGSSQSGAVGHPDGNRRLTWPDAGRVECLAERRPPRGSGRLWRSRIRRGHAIPLRLPGRRRVARSVAPAPSTSSSAVVGSPWRSRIIAIGPTLIGDPARIQGVTALGVDVTAFLAANGRRHTKLVSGRRRPASTAFLQFRRAGCPSGPGRSHGYCGRVIQPATTTAKKMMMATAATVNRQLS